MAKKEFIFTRSTVIEAETVEEAEDLFFEEWDLALDYCDGDVVKMFTVQAVEDGVHVEEK